MLVLYGNDNTLMLAFTDKDMQELAAGKTKEFNGYRQLVKDIIVFQAKDKAAVLELFKAANIQMTEKQRSDYLNDVRGDDGPKRTS